MTLDVLLRLLYRARRGDEEARLIAHDALLERYPLYAEYVEDSERPATERRFISGNPWGRQHVVVHPKRLIAASRPTQIVASLEPFKILDENQFWEWPSRRLPTPSVSGWGHGVTTYVSRNAHRSNEWLVSVFRNGRFSQTLGQLYPSRREAIHSLRQWGNYFTRSNLTTVVHRADEEPQMPRRR